MFNLLFILSLILTFVYFVLKTKKSLHMLQQNWYNDGNRYLKWLFKNKLKGFKTIEFILLVVLIIMCFIESNLLIFLYNLCYIIVIFVYYKEVTHEQSKKKLAVTARVKRLIFTILIIYLIPLILFPCFYGINIGNVVYYYFIIWILIFLNFLIIWIANIINIPVEKQVFYHFRRLATRKLEEMSSLKVVGITGSYGKTSSKNILNDILNVKMIATPSPQNFNTTYGLIRTINEHLDKFSEVFIAEMGAFKIGEIKELCDLVKPKYGILTRIGVAHLESFGSRENIQQGKFELIESLPSDGVAVLNMDDPYQTSYKLKNHCKVIWISINNEKADIIAKNIKLSHLGTTFDVYFKKDDKTYSFETKLLGNANIYNILAAIALGSEFGLSIEMLKIGVKKVQPIEHRLELKKYGNINIIDDAYNSNPIGSKMALDVLAMMPGKKVIVTPGMIELGSEQYQYNNEFGGYIADVADYVILIGEEQTKPIYDGLLKKKYKKENILILNDVKQAFVEMSKFQDKETYVLLENDLPDIFNE